MIPKKYRRPNNYEFSFDLSGRICVMDALIDSDYYTIDNIRTMTLRKLGFIIDFRFDIKLKLAILAGL